MSEVKLNNYPLSYYGLVMIEQSLNDLMAPYPLKDVLENECPMMDGKQVFTSNVYLRDRDITLNFLLYGDSSKDVTARQNFISRLSTLCNLLYLGKVTLNIKLDGGYDKTFTLVYRNMTSYAHNGDFTSAKIAIKFNEPNPAFTRS